MNIRVTTQTQVANTIANMERQTAALAKYQNQLSSGLRVALPSDDPTAYSGLNRAKAASLRYDAYTQTMSDTTAILNSGVSALGEVNSVLTRAKQIGLEGADATTDAFGYEALATEVDGLIDRAMSAANSQVEGKSLFGGTATGTTPFRVATTDANGRPATIAYDGAAERGRVLIGPGETMDARYAGDAVFQQAGGDVFASLIGLRDALRDTTLTGPAKSAAIGTQLASVEAARDAIGKVTAEQSSGLATLEAVQARVSDLKLTSDGHVSDLGSTDYPDAIVKMQAQQNSLQASLGVSAQLLQPSLLSFIR
jgi:flagellar hook-associated protein 3 FlgL